MSALRPVGTPLPGGRRGECRYEFTRLCNEQGINLTISKLEYCTDNAAMIGAAGYYAYKLGRRADLNLNAKANVELC